MSGYYLTVTAHVLAALLWLGGMLFFALVAAPVLRRVEPAELRAGLFRRLGEAFRLAGWVSIGVLITTGLANLRYRGWLGPALAGDAAFWASRAGSTLTWKIACVAFMVLLSAVHDFALGPRASRAGPGSPEAIRLRSRAAWLARINALAGLLLVWLSVRLARGG